jgi:SAM-dependent methyltransferase
MKNNDANAGIASCLVCGSSNLTEAIRTPPLPVMCNQRHHSAEAARRVSRAKVEIVCCRHCGHIFNVAFDPDSVTYDQTYENSLMGSPRYRQYTVELIERLVSKYALEGGTVVEIGCGRGEFLRMLCERGMRQAVGFDPSRSGEFISVGDLALIIVGSGFDTALAPRKADLVCARHVLEHLELPVPLLASVQMAFSSRPECVLFVEVPNGCYMMERRCIWDLIYEHVSYFTPFSLSRAIKSAGFAGAHIETSFGGQFLLAEARFGSPGAPADTTEANDEIEEQFTSFRSGFIQTIHAWERWLRETRQRGRRLALWGAGAKGVTFLNMLDRFDHHAITQVIDINPLKSGAFIAGTGHPISSPSALHDRQPDAILLMNSEYRTEVQAMLDSGGIRSDLIAVSGVPEP